MTVSAIAPHSTLIVVDSTRADSFDLCSHVLGRGSAAERKEMNHALQVFTSDEQKRSGQLTRAITIVVVVADVVVGM